MLLKRVQDHLQHIYELDIDEDVSQFVCTDRNLVAALDQSASPHDIPEKLLLQQLGDEIGVTLYLDENLLDHLGDHDPIQNLNYRNQAQYWTVLEGVSHFIYFSFNCYHDRPVSLYEMELQAEVDKYVSSLFLLLGQASESRSLHGSLFENVCFNPALDAVESARYAQADHFAALYCQWLYACYVENRKFQAIVNELRRFYRLPHHRKTDYIRSLV